MGLTSFLHLLWLVLPLSAIGLVALAAAYATVSAEVRHRRYLAGGLDLVDADMTQEQFGRYLSGYFHSVGYNVDILQQNEVTGTLLLVEKHEQRRIVFAKRSRNGVPSEEVSNALGMARALQIREATIITNSVLSRKIDEQVKFDGITVWDREKLIPVMGKVNARQFALAAIENHPV